MKPHVFRMAGWFPVLFLCALQLAVVAQDKVEKSVKEKVDVSGTWKWKFEMDNGDTVEPRVQLKQEGDKVTGTFVFRGDTEMEVKEGKVKGEDISFKVFSDRDERKVTTSFAGKISGDAIKGKVETDWSGERKSYDWEPKREAGIKLAKAEAESVNGNWKWSFETPNGDTIQSIAKLKQEGTRLSGTVTGRNGMEAEIKNGVVDHGEVSFKVERERNGQKVTILYNGKLSGGEIKGKIKSDFGGEERIVNWEAKRFDGPVNPSAGGAGTVDGTWKWSYPGQNGQIFESNAKLKQEGTKITGTISGRGGVETEIQDGKVENGEISFSTMRERDGTKITTQYRGKVAGNKIQGKTDSDLGGTSRSRDWEAQRTRE